MSFLSPGSRRQVGLPPWLLLFTPILCTCQSIGVSRLNAPLSDSAWQWSQSQVWTMMQVAIKAGRSLMSWCSVLNQFNPFDSKTNLFPLLQNSRMFFSLIHPKDFLSKDSPILQLATSILLLLKRVHLFSSPANLFMTANFLKTNTRVFPRYHSFKTWAPIAESPSYIIDTNHFLCNWTM